MIWLQGDFLACSYGSDKNLYLVFKIMRNFNPLSTNFYITDTYYLYFVKKKCFHKIQFLKRAEINNSNKNSYNVYFCKPQMSTFKMKFTVVFNACICWCISTLTNEIILLNNSRYFFYQCNTNISRSWASLEQGVTQ